MKDKSILGRFEESMKENYKELEKRIMNTHIRKCKSCKKNGCPNGINLHGDILIFGDIIEKEVQKLRESIKEIENQKCYCKRLEPTFKDGSCDVCETTKAIIGKNGGEGED